jgi:hypothetical protein
MENNSKTTVGETAGSSSSLIATEAQSSPSSAELDRLQQEAERLRSGMATSCRQRDMLRISLQQRAVYGLALRNKNAELSREIERLLVERATFLAEQARLTSEAAKWQAQYVALHHRIEAVLNRFWILPIYRSLPLRFRAFVRDRLPGRGQSQ